MDIVLVILVFLISFLVSFEVCTHNIELSKLLCPALFSTLSATIVYLA